MYSYNISIEKSEIYISYDDIEEITKKLKGNLPIPRWDDNEHSVRYDDFYSIMRLYFPGISFRNSQDLHGIAMTVLGVYSKHSVFDILGKLILYAKDGSSAELVDSDDNRFIIRVKNGEFIIKTEKK